MSIKWQANAGVTILNAFLVCLIIIQISNTQYHCFSSDLQNCKNLADPDQAQCASPGSFIGQLTGSQTDAQITLFCPWTLWRSLKVILISICILVIINWYSLRLILNTRWNIIVFVICLSITIPLMLVSGIMDIVYISSLDCSNPSLTNQTYTQGCNRIWFYINAILQVIGAVLIGVACASMIRWRKHEDKNEDLGSIEEQNRLINAEKVE